MCENCLLCENSKFSNILSREMMRFEQNTAINEGILIINLEIVSIFGLSVPFIIIIVIVVIITT